MGDQNWKRRTEKSNAGHDASSGPIAIATEQIECDAQSFTAQIAEEYDLFLGPNNRSSGP